MLCQQQGDWQPWLRYALYWVPLVVMCYVRSRHRRRQHQGHVVSFTCQSSSCPDADAGVSLLTHVNFDSSGRHWTSLQSSHTSQVNLCRSLFKCKRCSCIFITDWNNCCTSLVERASFYSSCSLLLCCIIITQLFSILWLSSWTDCWHFSWRFQFLS